MALSAIEVMHTEDESMSNPETGTSAAGHVL